MTGSASIRSSSGQTESKDVTLLTCLISQGMDKNPLSIDLNELVAGSSPHEWEFYGGPIGRILDMEPVLTKFKQLNEKMAKGPLSGGEYYFLWHCRCLAPETMNITNHLLDKAIEKEYALALMDKADGYFIGMDLNSRKKAISYYQKVILQSANSMYVCNAHLKLGSFFCKHEKNFKTAFYHFEQGALKGDRGCEIALWRLLMSSLGVLNADTQAVVMLYRQTIEERNKLRKLSQYSVHTLLGVFKDSFTRQSISSYLPGFVNSYGSVHTFLLRQLAFDLASCHDFDGISKNLVSGKLFIKMLTDFAKNKPAQFAEEVGAAWRNLKPVFEQGLAEQIEKIMNEKQSEKKLSSEIKEAKREGAPSETKQDSDSLSYAAVLDKVGGSPLALQSSSSGADEGPDHIYRPTLRRRQVGSALV